MEILKQDQYRPLPFDKQILIIFAGTNGFLDDMPLEKIRDFEAQLYKFVDTSYPKLGQTIMEKKTIDDALKAEIQKALKEFKERFVGQAQLTGAKA